MRSKYIARIESIDDTWDSYCSTFKQMGIDDVIAAYQTAYERCICQVKNPPNYI